MIRSILVPLDGSSFGEQALPLALSIARRAGASLQLVHVAAPDGGIHAEPFIPPGDLGPHTRVRELDYLDRVVQRLFAVSAVPVTADLLDGEVAEAIHDRAVETGADLVVMTTHGRGPLGRFWLGSVADELARRLPLSLLLVRASPARADPRREPALGDILVPLDGSPLAEQALGPAVALGTLMDSQYTLLQVLHPVLPPVPLGGPVGEGVQRLLEQAQASNEQLRRGARRYLDGVAERLRARGLTVRTRVALSDQPASVILRAASAGGCDLVALATRGRRGLARLLLGSVADKLIRGADVPVLVHHPVGRPAACAGRPTR